MKALLMLVSFCFFSWSSAQDNNLPKPMSSKPQKNAEFPGGIDAFNKIVQSHFNAKNVKCSGAPVSAKVNFSVDIQGNMLDIKAEGSNDNLNTEAVKAVQSVKEKWTPGSSYNKNAKAYFSVPFRVSCD